MIENLFAELRRRLHNRLIQINRMFYRKGSETMYEALRVWWRYTVNTHDETGKPVQKTGRAFAFDTQEVIDWCKKYNIIHGGFRFISLYAEE